MVKKKQTCFHNGYNLMRPLILSDSYKSIISLSHLTKRRSEKKRTNKLKRLRKVSTALFAITSLFVMSLSLLTTVFGFVALFFVSVSIVLRWLNLRFIAVVVVIAIDQCYACFVNIYLAMISCYNWYEWTERKIYK